ncbi:MAG: DUF6282 family protein [Armatimonadota bacterium]|nr:DUF6282 family protein [Armatimonadota bacterium]MDR7534475.1 DUF6282 family protein [Armatimonadota bacterium]MDR7535784.1 DUF6282 family protein [Armatimonadota bacterium]
MDAATQRAKTRREHKPVTPERVAALQGTDWVHAFFERYPRLRTLRAGAEEPFLRDAIDVHVHANPDTLGPRSQDISAVAVDAARAGMRAILHKDHHHSTVGVAYMAQRLIDQLVERGELPRRVEVYGGIATAFSTDPRLVQVLLASPQMRMIFFNCIYSEPLVEGGRVTAQARELIRIAADHGIPITLCPPNHSVKQDQDDFEGTLPLVEAIADAGARALLDHPVSAFTIDQTVRLVEFGVYAGVFCYPVIPTVAKAPAVDPDLVYDMIRAVGPERCVIGSDMGHILEPDAVSALRLLVRLLLAFALTDEQITRMCKTNPERLLFG